MFFTRDFIYTSCSAACFFPLPSVSPPFGHPHCCGVQGVGSVGHPSAGVGAAHTPSSYTLQSLLRVVLEAVEGPGLCPGLVLMSSTFTHQGQERQGSGSARLARVDVHLLQQECQDATDPPWPQVSLSSLTGQEVGPPWSTKGLQTNSKWAMLKMVQGDGLPGGWKQRF